MRLLTVKEAAPVLGFNATQLWRLIRENKFPFPRAVIRFGKQIRIAVDLIEESVRAGQAQAKSQKAA